MLGVIGLDTDFKKPVGHIRNPESFDFPSIQVTVSGATTHRLVRQADRDLLAPFIESAQELERRGATAITSGCGYMARFQPEIAQAVDVPVFLSSLMQVPLAAAMIPADSAVGVLVADEESFDRGLLAGVGAGHVTVRIGGMARQPEFRTVMLEQARSELDLRALQEETRQAAANLVRQHPDIGALVVECTDLAPFSRDIQAVAGCPVFDALTLADIAHKATKRPSYH
jgi:aspartate/glutamate racemase